MISSVQLLSHVRLFSTLWTAACQASLSITNSWSLLKLMSIESVMPSNHLIEHFSICLLAIFISPFLTVSANFCPSFLTRLFVYLLLHCKFIYYGCESFVRSKNQRWHKEIERYTMFLDWKNQCEKDYTTPNNLQFQCFYQLTNDIFHRTRIKIVEICMETKDPE